LTTATQKEHKGIERREGTQKRARQVRKTEAPCGEKNRDQRRTIVEILWYVH